MTPAPNQLWNLGGRASFFCAAVGALFELLEARESAAEQVRIAEQFQADTVQDETFIREARAELAAIEHGITQFVAQQLRDVDGLRAPLKALEQGVAINKADAAAATNRAMVLQNRYDKLKDLIRSCMIALDQAGEWKPKESRKFESARGSFTLRGNGGVQPVEITDEALVPDEYCRVTVTMPLTRWNDLIEFNRVHSVGTKADVNRLHPDIKVGPREVSRSAVAEALAKPCPECECKPINCGMCGGSGKQGVPGARLAERGVSVVIK